MLVSQLSESQVNDLTALLSEPTSLKPPQPMIKPFSAAQEAVPSKKAAYDPLKDLVIESDLRRLVNANIAHHRNIGTHKGRRHAMRYPVRGQGTRNKFVTLLLRL
jgi:small subunit ribosomal protein S13